MKEKIRTYRELEGEDRSRLLSQVLAQRDRVTARLERVKRIIAVMSGKGGVGKSFVTASLAAMLAESGRRVGVLDADLAGPTAARMLAAKGPLVVNGEEVEPATALSGVRVISSDLLLQDEAPLKWKEPSGDGFIWRGALETGMLREFLADVAWGELDVLLVDLPPGTERLSALIGLVPRLAGVLAVTIPSDASRRAVARSLEVAREAGVKVLGVVENMSGYACPECGETSPLFAGGAGEALARQSGAPLLAAVPFDPSAQGVDGGRPAVQGPAADALRRLATLLMEGAP